MTPPAAPVVSAGPPPLVKALVGSGARHLATTVIGALATAGAIHANASGRVVDIVVSLCGVVLVLVWSAAAKNDATAKWLAVIDQIAAQATPALNQAGYIGNGQASNAAGNTTSQR